MCNRPGRQFQSTNSNRYHANMPSSYESDGDNPSKIRRVSRACLQVWNANSSIWDNVNQRTLQCRTRKQRCLPSLMSNLQAPCKRCRQHGITCSFQTEPVQSPDVSPSPLQVAQIVVDLQRRYVRWCFRLQSQQSWVDMNTDSMSMRLALQNSRKRKVKVPSYNHNCKILLEGIF